jgi:hypothetical protein
MQTPGRDILARYPKHRPVLDADVQAVFDKHYKLNREGKTKVTSLSMRMESWLHKKVAEDVAGKTDDIPTLEIGAGTFNQLPYEPQIRTYDVVEPFEAFYTDSPHKHRIRKIFTDISEVPADSRYDRITSAATFEHILNLPEVVARAALLLSPGGSLRVSIPNEGTLLWRMGTMVTGFEFRRMHGMDYQLLMRHEHVNTADEVEAVIRYFFKQTEVAVFGLNRRFAFYRFICGKEPDLEKAREYLEEG